MFQIIFQFAFFFLEQTYLQKNDVIYQYKKPINGEKLKLFLKISINVTGVPLKPMRMQMKLNNFISTFCTIYDAFFPMNKMQTKTKDLQSPGITKESKNLLERSNVCIQSFKKKEMKKQKKNIKITKTFLNLLRSGRRNCIFLN